MRKWIKKMQQQPYETRVKILWIGVVASAVLIILIWIITGGKREPQTSDPPSSPSQIKEIFNNLREIREKR